jgi:hypothetical protein
MAPEHSRPSPDRADTPAMAMSRGATGRLKVDATHTRTRTPPRSHAEGLVETRLEGNTAQVNRLDQLFAQSQREIEAHAVEIAATETGRYYIDEAAHLLAGLRMWAQAQYRSDQVVRQILEAGDATALQQVARELRLMKNREATVASWPVEAIAKWPAEQRTAVTSYALRALRRRRPPRPEHHRRPDAETLGTAQPTGADF